MDNSLIISLKFSENRLDTEKGFTMIMELEDILAQIVQEKNLGYLDGNEFCEDTVSFYFYGKNVQEMWKELLPWVIRMPFLPESYATMTINNIQHTISLE